MMPTFIIELRAVFLAVVGVENVVENPVGRSEIALDIVSGGFSGLFKACRVRDECVGDVAELLG